MKLLFFLKRLDLLIQIMCLVVPLAFAVFGHDPTWFFWVYFVVGGSQVVSCVLHTFIKSAWRASNRKNYERAVFWLILVGGLSALALTSDAIADSLFGALLLLVGCVYLLSTPVAAVWYFCICLRETAAVHAFVQRKELIIK